MTQQQQQQRMIIISRPFLPEVKNDLLCEAANTICCFKEGAGTGASSYLWNTV